MNPWVLAARPATLPAGVAAVVVGSALAGADGVFRWDAFLVTLFAAIAIQVGVNYANDLADAEKGADTAARIGPTRAVASGLLTAGHMKRGIAVSFGLAAMTITIAVGSRVVNQPGTRRHDPQTQVTVTGGLDAFCPTW